MSLSITHLMVTFRNFVYFRISKTTLMYSEKIQTPVCLLLVLAMFSCASKKDTPDGAGHEVSSEQREWKEMDAFHLIMAETFHPYKDSANLEPAKARASELMQAADQWAAAPLPAKVDSEEVSSKLNELKSETATLAESVKSADDNVIAENLTRVHDTFHAIQEAWYQKH